MAVSKLRHPIAHLQIPVGILLLLAVLYVAKAVIIPLVMAILLTFILTPIVIALQRYGIRRVYSVVITVLFTFTIIGVTGYVIGSQIHDLARGLPKHKVEIQAKMADLREGGGAFAELMQMVREINEGEAPPKAGPGVVPAKEQEVIITRPEPPSSAEKVYQTVVPIVEPLAHAGFVVILVIFMLLRREDLRNRFLGLLGDGGLTGTTRVIVDSAQRISRYLLAQLLINLGFGLLFTVGLYFIEVEYAILWGFVTAMMRFIPYIGTWISLLLPLALSFATSETWTQPVVLIVYFSVLDLITANVVEPLLLGHHTGVSPIALLVAAAFWTWLWGPIGLILSTPLTVCLVVIGQHVPRFRFFALMFGDQPALAPHVRYYQRLLARDEREAKEVAVEYVAAHGLEKVYDSVLIPALALARVDRQNAGLEAEDEEFIIHSTREILSAIVANAQAIKSAEPVPAVEQAEEAATGLNGTAKPIEAAVPSEPRLLILGCPAHQQAEELALQMLASLVQKDGYDVETVSTRALPAEIEALIAQKQPSLIFIAVLPPGGLVQARYLCKRLRRRFADLPILVGYWGPIRDLDRLLRQVRSAGGNLVATSLLQAQTQIGIVLRPASSEEQKEKTTAIQKA